jgi:hypothetical protein
VASSAAAVSEESWPPAQGEARRDELAHTVSASASFPFSVFNKTFFELFLFIFRKTFCSLLSLKILKFFSIF